MQLGPTIKMKYLVQGSVCNREINSIVVNVYDPDPYHGGIGQHNPIQDNMLVFQKLWDCSACGGLMVRVNRR